MNTTKGLVVPAGGGKHLDMTAPGRFAALKLLGHETNESVMMFEETMPAGTKSLFHLHHDSDEVAWVLAGEITFRIGDEVTVGGPGTCAFFPRNVPHAWKNTGSETGRVVFLYTPAAAGGYVEELLNRPGPMNDDATQGAPRALPLGSRRPKPALSGGAVRFSARKLRRGPGEVERFLVKIGRGADDDRVRIDGPGPAVAERRGDRHARRCLAHEDLTEVGVGARAKRHQLDRVGAADLAMRERRRGRDQGGSHHQRP